ncbi:MAG: hypothetical protein ACHRXM_30375 [Isosphaerales bacterium]
MVKLRTELELLQLEHEADKAHLLNVMKGMRDYESMSPKQATEAATMSMYFNSEAMELQQAREEASRKKLEAARPEEFAKVREEVDRETEEGRKGDIDAVIRKTRADAKAYVDRKKKDFSRQAAEINERSLDLIGIEKRYNDAN